MKRPFTGLSLRAGPDAVYDAVVIGAGVGGLACANLLARAGLRVLLAEQHYMVGGYCSTFRRQGYTFDAASHFYPLLGNPRTLTGRLLADLGARTRWVKMDPVDQFHLPDGSCFSVPANFDAYLTRLKAAFPEEAHRIDEFFALVKKYYLLGILWHFRGAPVAEGAEYARATVGEVIERLFRHPRLKLLLTADCAHWGSPPARTSFVFDCMLRYAYFLGNYYPVGGSQAFADDLAARFEEAGGHLLLRSRATRILTEHGRVCGVELETGPVRDRRSQRVRAGAVVSNADLVQTVERLLGPESVGAGWLRPFGTLRPTYPCFLMYLGLRDVPAEQMCAAHGYHWRTYDYDAVGRDAFLFKVFVPTLYEPAMAPPDGQVVIVQKVLDMDYAAVADWPAHKQAVEEFVFARLAERIPDLAEKVVVRLSASARTSFRFTLNQGGAMLGWEMSPDQVGGGRPDVVTPLPGLFLAGHWTRPGGGITPALVSAMMAARAVTAAAGGGEALVAAGAEGGIA